MKSIRSITLVFILELLIIVCFVSCNNFLTQKKSSVNLELPSNLFDILSSRAGDGMTNTDPFVLNATMSGGVEKSITKTLANTTDPISIVFSDVPISSVITVEVSILRDGIILYSGKSPETTVSTANFTVNLTLRPVFSTYTITYELNGGNWVSGFIAPDSYMNTNNTALPRATNVAYPGLPNNVLIGWTEAADGSGSVLTSIPAGTSGNKTLYAQWGAGGLITYELNGGSWGSGFTAPDSYITANSTALPGASDIQKQSNVFAGWTETADGAGSVLTTISSGSSGSKILYAKWVSGTITYELNGGNWVSGFTAPDSYINLNNTELPGASNIEKSSFALLGWTETADVSNIAITTIPARSLGSKTLYAQWVESVSATDSDVVATIGNVSPSAFKHIKVTGTISDTTIGNIKTALVANSTAKIFLDLSAATGITTIGDSAFSDCLALVRIDLPSSVTSIGGTAFYGCKSLMGVTIPSSVTSIGTTAFYQCSRLHSVIIPDGVTEIKDTTFRYCYSLSGITFGRGVVKIALYAFEDCPKLNSSVFLDTTKTWRPTSNDDYTGGEGLLPYPQAVNNPWNDFFLNYRDKYLYVTN